MPRAKKKMPMHKMPGGRMMPDSEMPMMSKAKRKAAKRMHKGK